MSKRQVLLACLGMPGWVSLPIFVCEFICLYFLTHREPRPGLLAAFICMLCQSARPWYKGLRLQLGVWTFVEFLVSEARTTSWCYKGIDLQDLGKTQYYKIYKYTYTYTV